MSAPAPGLPEAGAMPAAFAVAWMARDADALAALGSRPAREGTANAEDRAVVRLVDGEAIARAATQVAAHVLCAG